MSLHFSPQNLPATHKANNIANEITHILCGLTKQPSTARRKVSTLGEMGADAVNINLRFPPRLAWKRADHWERELHIAVNTSRVLLQMEPSRWAPSESQTLVLLTVLGLAHVLHSEV